MKRIRIQDLKAHLSSAVAEAEAGTTIIVTRHNQPVAQLMPFRSPHVHYGSKNGTGLSSAIKGGTNGRALELLDEDRGDR